MKQNGVRQARAVFASGKCRNSRVERQRTLNALEALQVATDEFESDSGSMQPHLDHLWKVLRSHGAL